MSKTAQILEINEYYYEKSLNAKEKPDVSVVTDLRALDIMTFNVVTISQKATIDEAVKLFLDERVTALAVVDHNDNPVGVFSETDLARFERERPHIAMDDSDVAIVNQLNADDSGQGDHFHVESVANPCIADWMTPLVLTVNGDDSLKYICQTLAENRIHRVFVKENDKLVGVISSMDITSTLAMILSAV